MSFGMYENHDDESIFYGQILTSVPMVIHKQDLFKSEEIYYHNYLFVSDREYIKAIKAQRKCWDLKFDDRIDKKIQSQLRKSCIQYKRFRIFGR